MMTSTGTQAPRASVFSPLAKSVLDSFAEGVVVFDHEGHVTYANGQAQQVLNSLGNGDPENAEALMPRLARLGGRVARLRVGSLTCHILISGLGRPSLNDRTVRQIWLVQNKRPGRP